MLTKPIVFHFRMRVTLKFFSFCSFFCQNKISFPSLIYFRIFFKYAYLFINKIYMVISNVNFNLCLRLGVIGYTFTQLNTAIEFLLTNQAQILQFNYTFKDHRLTIQIKKINTFFFEFESL